MTILNEHKKYEEKQNKYIFIIKLLEVNFVFLIQKISIITDFLIFRVIKIYLL